MAMVQLEAHPMRCESFAYNKTKYVTSTALLAIISYTCIFMEPIAER